MVNVSFRIKICLLLTLSLFWAGSGLSDSRGSASYRIPSEVMGFSGGGKASSSYNSFGVLSGLNLGEGSSASYSMREGFLPAAFPTLAMLVTSITPSSGYNTGTINITNLAGSGFLPGSTVTLSRTGESDVAATNVTVVNGTTITCTFNLTGLRTGLWDVVVTDPGGPSSRLPGAFNVLTHATLSLAVNDPNPFDPAAGPTTILYQLAQDTDVTVAIISTTADLLWKRNYAAGSNGGRAGDNSLAWDGLTDFSQRASTGVYLFRVIERSTAKTLVKGKIAVIRR